ncbi:uncharacterized protein BJ171DRAFT_587943 [Polychytrium aggregatum]|uniref:uncharacterized protein n=1 Tax=Polychytrium aggregatum TaxID=110093 RepID=UPI0022FECA9B|nr:uncharacterized protein BJ171DRAFT_587943 [Polychytrium aggregatum]KAI9193262.1 hypothetical protein BJ171DRAFT_587943 [Polychytrium aggregatum]
MKNPIAIPGLHYIPNAITEEQEQQIFRIVDSRPYSTTIHRRQQFYGERYYHTTHDLTALQPMTEQQAKLQSYPLEDMQWLLDHLLPKVAMVTSVVNDTQPPTQILVNEYRENMGIASHFEDALAFGSYILTLSLRNPIWMTMKLPREHTNHCSDILQQTRVLLEPRSLLVMSGESRFDWRHGISKTKTVEGPGGMPAVKRDCGYRRISLTIRYLLDGRKRTLSDRNVPWAPRP